MEDNSKNLRENTIVKCGIFWAVPDEIMGQSVLEISKAYSSKQANSIGFINYSYSHFEAWDEVRGSFTCDCYHYPRGRVLYDINNSKHIIFADTCVSLSAIDKIIQIFEIEDYEIRRDEHYVCAFCQGRGKQHSQLKYNILRGSEKIGENIIEISYGETKILVELGKSLEGGGGQFESEIINNKYTAVVISHYHEDHAGLIGQKHDCPLYMGRGTYNILRTMADWRGEEMPQNVKTYRSGHSFKIGGIKVTPYLCDHSAFDSYMLLFEAGGKSILYTGDFRFHGRKNKEKLLVVLPKSVDVLIHEGTNIGKSPCTVTETELENKAVEIMKNTKGPVFVLQSASNIDRLVSIYRASKRSGRLLYMDNYTSQIAFAAGGNIPRPDVFKDVIAFTPRAVRGKRRDDFMEIENKRGIKGIANGTSRYTMLVRPSMLEYIKKLNCTAHICGATLIYSMWKGYKDTENMQKFLSEMQSLGVNTVDLHTSGHASEEDIELLKNTVNAKKTVCVHTDFKV